MSFLTPVWNYVDALVHPSAQQDALTAARHRAFIAPRLLGSFAALASFPVYIAFRGVPNALEVGVFGWLVAPILIAYFLSRTGRYESAHVHVLAVAHRPGDGGGLVHRRHRLVRGDLAGGGAAGSRALRLAPRGGAGLDLRARRRRIAAAASARSACCRRPSRSASEHGALAALGIISAALYAIGLALGAEQLARTSVWLLYAEEDRYRLLARNMTDVITRHGRNGAVLFVSPAAEPLFGVRAGELAGHGLFDRVHVADRPAYLTALADAAALGEDRSVEFRIRRSGDAEPYGGHFVWVEMRCRPLDPADRDIRRARSGRGAARRQRAQDAGTRARDRARKNRSAPTPPRAASSPP